MFEDDAPPRSEMFTSPNVRCLFCNKRLSTPPAGKNWLKAEWGTMQRQVCQVCPDAGEDKLKAKI